MSLLGVAAYIYAKRFADYTLTDMPELKYYVPKMFSGIHSNVSIHTSLQLFLCLHYVPSLKSFHSTLSTEDCSIRVFYYKLTVLLESIVQLATHLSALNSSLTVLLGSFIHLYSI